MFWGGIAMPRILRADDPHGADHAYDRGTCCAQVQLSQLFQVTNWQ
jgi:hypothetical protein